MRPQSAGIELAVSREKSSEASQQKVARKNASSIFKQAASKTEGPLPDQPEEISRHLSEHRPGTLTIKNSVNKKELVLDGSVNVLKKFELQDELGCNIDHSSRRRGWAKIWVH